MLVLEERLYYDARSEKHKIMNFNVKIICKLYGVP